MVGTASNKKVGGDLGMRLRSGGVLVALIPSIAVSVNLERFFSFFALDLIMVQ